MKPFQGREEARVYLNDLIYQAIIIRLASLEENGSYRGNSHHLAQKLQADVMNSELCQRFLDDVTARIPHVPDNDLPTEAHERVDYVNFLHTELRLERLLTGIEVGIARSEAIAGFAGSLNKKQLAFLEILLDVLGVEEVRMEWE